MSLSITVTGGIGPVMERMKRAMEGLIRRTADLAETEMRRRAPVRTGELRRSIKKRIDVPNLSAEIGPGVKYAIFVEMGTRPHVIRPVRARALRFEVGGEVVFAAYVHHPGTKPQPFVRGTAEEVRRRIPGLWLEAWR